MPPSRRPVVTGSPPKAANGRVPLWLVRAMRAPLKTGDNETVRTATSELDGKTIIYPTIRMKVEGTRPTLYRPDDPAAEAIKKNDYIVVPDGVDPRAMSRRISRMIGQRRKERDL